DLLFVFLNPGETLLKGHLFLLPITIGKVDRQPVRSAFAQRLAVGKLEQRPSDMIGLWIHQWWHGVDASAMIHLPGKIEFLFGGQPYRLTKAERHHFLQTLPLVLTRQSEKREPCSPRFPLEPADRVINPV